MKNARFFAAMNTGNGFRSYFEETFGGAERRYVIKGGPGFEMQGGHAVLVCGYDEGGFLIMNSWGKSYGKDGKVYVSNRAFERQFMYGAVLTRVFDGAE